MKVVLVDSYDSFTHNLEQALGMLGARVEVVRSDEETAATLMARSPDRLVLGPGPGRPEDASCLVEAVRVLGPLLPILGVCLGHQAIGLAFGGRVIRHTPVHGHATPIHHDARDLFAGLPAGAPMTRYHSLVVDPSALPSVLLPTAWSDDGALMGIRHRELPVVGVQFHPESVLSGAAGLRLLGNFLSPPAQQRRPAAGIPAPAG